MHACYTPDVNFLAHLHLAHPTGASYVGNLMPDLVRGRPPADLPAEVHRGIERHRAIDAITDTHPIPSRTRARLRTNHGRFAGLLVDVFYDHALASNWARWHAAPLRRFVDEAYASLLAHRRLMPDSMGAIVERMAGQDWLGSYATAGGMAARLQQMADRFHHRFGRTFDPEQATRDLIDHRPAIAEDFEKFYIELIDRLDAAAEPPVRKGGDRRPAAQPL